MTTPFYARVSRVAAAAGLAAALAAPHHGLAQAAPARSAAGVSRERLARLDSVLDREVASGKVAGVVGLVLRDGRVIYEHAAGWADRESSRRMAPNTIVRIASQSKALTSVAIMTLIEEGKLTLDTPVGRLIPTFAKTTVMPAGATEAVPATRAITIRDLLTHTAGISYGTDARVAEAYRAKALGPAAGWGWYTADKSEPVCTTMERLGTLPFVAQPGSAWVYGYNTDILGCVVEKVSGMSLDAYLQWRVIGPLRMTDTHFYLPQADRNRFATVYMSDSTQHAVRAPDGPKGQGDYVDGPRVSFSGGAGLLSTARDYARFLQMLLNEGTLDGVRILAPRTVEMMRTNQSGTLYAADGSRGFGLGFSTVERLGADGFKSVGAYGWGGAYGSSYTVDPKERLVIVFMIQQLPNASDIPSRFTNMVYQALVPATK